MLVLAGCRAGNTPDWIRAGETLDAEILRIEKECRALKKDPSAAYELEWEVCPNSEHADDRDAWIYYGGEVSAYDVKSGKLEYYKTDFRCDPSGPWFWPHLREVCGHTFRSIGSRPACGGTPLCHPSTERPCTQDQLVRFGCEKFAGVRDAVKGSP